MFTGCVDRLFECSPFFPKMRSQWREALFGVGAGDRGLQLPIIAYNVAIVACESWPLALQLLDILSHPNSRTFASAMSLCLGQWSMVTRLLHCMQLKQIEPNESSWNSCIKACIKACSKAWRKALALFQRMPSPDAISVTLAIGAQSWEHALRMLDSHRLHVDCISRSSALSSCAKGEAWEKAAALSSWSAFDISSSMSCVTWLKALQLLNTSLQCTQLSLYTLNACAGRGAWRHTLALRGLRADVVTYGAWASRCIGWEKKLQLLQSALEQAVLLNKAARNAAIAPNSWRHAVQLAFHMDISLSVAINACGKALEWQQAIALLTQQRLKPSSASFAAAIWACRAQWPHAALLLQNCRLEVAYSGAMAAASWQVASGLLDDMVAWALYTNKTYPSKMRFNII